MIPVGDEKLPVQRIAEARDAIWARALREFQNGLQTWSTDEEMDRILTRNSDYDLVDPWSDLIGDWLKRQGTAAYVQRQQIYDFLDIGPERQNNFNAQRIRELTKFLLRRELRQLQHELAAILGTGQKNMRPTGAVLQALTTSARSRSGVVSGS